MAWRQSEIIKNYLLGRLRSLDDVKLIYKKPASKNIIWQATGQALANGKLSHLGALHQ